MTNFPRIMVPLSLTESDAGLLRYARSVAKTGIVQEILFAHAAPPGRLDLEVAQRTAEMETLVAAHFAAPAETKLTFKTGCGSRVDWLLEASLEFKADLIMLGHRRARSGTRSLAQRLSQLAACSVWLVPEGSFPAVQRLLAPVDFSEHSAHSLTVATALARAFGLDRCLSLHTSFDPSLLRYYENVVAKTENERAAMTAFLQRVNANGVRIEPRFDESPNVAASILRVAANENIDLIVMSTRGRSRAVAILLGSVTAQVMAEAPMPVLAVKHHGARLNLFQILSDARLWAQPNPKTN